MRSSSNSLSKFRSVRLASSSKRYKSFKLKLNFLLVDIQDKITKLKEKENFLKQQIKVENKRSDVEEKEFIILFQKLNLTCKNGQTYW